MLLAAVVSVFPSRSMSQTVSRKTVDQYRQMVTMCNGAQRATFSACGAQLKEYGFTYNASGVIDMFTMQMHPFMRSEGRDTVVCVLVTLSDTVYTVSGVFCSIDASRTYGVEPMASDLQAQLAAKMGCTKYVGSVKGKVKKVSYNREDIITTVAGADADMVSMVYEQWKSEDGRRELTCIYKNNRYGKKKPKDKDKVEITLSVGNTTK